MIYIKALFADATEAARVQDERLKLRRDVERYRFLLRKISDPALITMLEEMIAEAEARLTSLDVRWRTDPQGVAPSGSGHYPDVRQDHSAVAALRTPLSQVGEWHLDSRTREATSPTGKTVRLTKGEYELLLAFLTHADQILSRNDLMVLSQHRSPARGERTIDVLIGRLRRKLEADPRHPARIRTVRNEGYVFRSRSDG